MINTETEECEGATLKERLLEACRRDNVELLESTLRGVRDTTTVKATGTTKANTPHTNTGTSKQAIAHLINTTRDPTGDYPLHLAAKYGNFDVTDILLDQELVDVDPVNRTASETPLHVAIHAFCRIPHTPNNECNLDREKFLQIALILIDAGADTRIKNKFNQRPIDLLPERDDLDYRNLRDALKKADYAYFAGDDVIASEEDEE